jgi:ADP-heptose:LPS heptosyltransferase
VLYPWLAEAGGADAAIPIGSLPALRRRQLRDFPHRAFYLRAAPQEQDHWRGWLAAQSGGPHVGVSWRSGLGGGMRSREYAPLEVWAQFIAAMRATPVCLQYAAQPDEIARLEALSGRRIVVPPGLDQKQEIDRTAALAAALDGVVSAPTSVAWIAAAVGTPTLKVLHSDTWTGFGADHEPFAPACRLIRPRHPGDWTEAFGTALAALNI